MYETAVGSGVYEEASDTTWNNDNYVFNKKLSKCENGSKVYWDETLKRVMMEASVSDKCYIYFDRIS